MSVQAIQILCVEDNPGDAFIIQAMLGKIEVPTIEFTHVERLDDAFKILAQRPVDAVLLDLSLPDSYGIETVQAIQTQYPSLPTIILTGTDDENLAVQALHEGAQDYLVKEQVSDYILHKAIRYAIERKKIELELKQRTAELEQTNQTLEQRTAQLEFANQELEAFNYAVSHDLVNPLTIILGSTSLISFQYGEQLNQQLHKHITEITKAAEHIHQLIDDLLRLSKISRSDIQVEQVDLSYLSQQIFVNLQHRAPNRNVEVSIHPKLVAQGDANLLNIALENLLENAWKYTGKHRHARIEFGNIDDTTTVPLPFKSLPIGHSIFFIRDNGAGFDMTKAHNLFKPFQRLHKTQDFQGNGIGLATVQRIIQRHEGEIWAEASIGDGATFYFTLPNPQ